MTESQTIKASMCSPKKQHFIVGWNDIANGINTSRSKESRDIYISSMRNAINPDTKNPYVLGCLAALNTYKNLKQSKLFRLDY